MEKIERNFSQVFELREFIAQGNFAKVFKCVERKTGCVFAAKEFQAHENNYDKKQIDSEVDIWRALHHHNIVSMHNRFYDDSTVWVVLEFVNGKTLFDEILNQIDFTEEQSRRIVQQVSVSAG